MAPCNPHINDRDLGLGSGQSKHSVLYSTEIDDENNGNLVKRCWDETVYPFMWAFKRTSRKNQSIPVEVQNEGFFWPVLGLFRLFLSCPWVVQVVLGLFRGVPSFSNNKKRKTEQSKISAGEASLSQ